jgi:hypothetical protein
MNGETSVYEKFPSHAEVRQRGYPYTTAEEAAIKGWQEQWLVENRAAIESSNRWVERHGLPLAKYRMF